MPSDSRNFRSNYLEKVGLRGSGDDKKVLEEQILKDSLIDRAKLVQFATKCDVPASYRVVVWKLLLGVSSLNAEARDFVDEQRQEQYALLLRGLETMRKLCSVGPILEPVDLLRMWLLEQSMLAQNDTRQVESVRYIPFLSISRRLLEICEQPTDAYWISKKMDILLIEKEKETEKLFEELAAEVRTELIERDKELEHSLENIGFWSRVPVQLWLRSALADILELETLQKLWDKLIAGCLHIMVYVVVEILVNFESHWIDQLSERTEMDLNQAVIDCIKSELSADSQHVLFVRAEERCIRSGGFMRPRSTSSSKSDLTIKKTI